MRMEANAFQRVCDFAIQKSIRESFRLVVSEAFWKGKALVSGRAGGIPMQFPHGYERYLVTSTEGPQVGSRSSSVIRRAVGS